MIKIQGVTKTFGMGGDRVVALEPLSEEIRRGEFVSIVGPSGCGKSTLLRLIAGLEIPTDGKISIDIPNSTRPIGFVFQDAVLFPWKTVFENIRFPLDTAGIPRKRSSLTVKALIELIGLSGFEEALPKQLSGGMRQRAAIARALADDPPILLMDEPFSSVDLMTRETLNDELLKIWKQTGKTILLVTHSVEEAAYLGTRVMVMSARPGRLRKTYRVNVSQPRGEASKRDPTYLDLVGELKKMLRDQTQ